MSVFENTRIYYINTGNSLIGTNNTYSQAIQINESEKFDRVVLLQAEIPVSYYVINEGSNEFLLTELGTSVSIQIPRGNYNAESFSIAVKALLDLNSPNGYTYSIRYPNNYTENNTGLFTYTVNTNASPISLEFGDTPLVEQFGFQRRSINEFTPGLSTSSLMSDVVMKFIPEDTIFVHSSLVDNGSDDVLQPLFFGNSSVLGNLSYLCPDPLAYSKPLVSVSDKAPIFTFTDENNTPVYFNGQNVVLTVMFFKVNKIYDEIKSSLARLRN